MQISILPNRMSQSIGQFAVVSGNASISSQIWATRKCCCACLLQIPVELNREVSNLSTLFFPFRTNAPNKCWTQTVWNMTYLYSQFHRYLRRTATVKTTELKGVQEGIVGPWELSDIANMDQTPRHQGSYLCRKRRKVSMDSNDKWRSW